MPETYSYMLSLLDKDKLIQMLLKSFCFPFCFHLIDFIRERRFMTIL